MITAENITKKIGSKTILKGIDLHIAKGEFITVFGPNGAGKSTLLKILAILMKPSGGTLTINGFNTNNEVVKVRGQIGVISHQTLLYDSLTAYENLEFYGRMYGVDNLRERIFDVLQEVGLEYAFNDPVRTFSRGMQQRLAIARATIHQPEILFLDEPYTGLDQQAIEILNSVLHKFNIKDRTVFMITHNFEQGLDLSDKVLIISKGRIVYERKAAGLMPHEMKDVYINTVGGKV
ncbi:MAG: heme ABC exporter ATP-binding protein CcmA [Nitrospiraceae bacterium]|nr:MAG: heme ABC exporter ATP-binding protein CcmA [Nitrospiraceae bacterium]